MTSGRVSDVDDVLSRVLDDTFAIVQEHIVVEVEGVTGIVKPDGGSPHPYAVTVRSTQSRVHQSIGETVYLTGAEREGEAIALIRSGMVDLALDINHGDIDIGSALYVGLSADGTVISGTNPTTTAERLLLVGWAEEHIVQPASGERTQETVRASLDMRGANF